MRTRTKKDEAETGDPGMNILGIEKAKELSKNGILDVWGEFTNKRKAQCKICGKEIEKGEGIGAYFYAMRVGRALVRHMPKCKARLGKSCICWFRYNHVFVCEECDNSINEELE